MAISVFLSYSRKDETAARQVVSDLERGHVSVWRDSELRGGDPWWQKILEHIRECDVFIFALSNNGLASKPCRAELAYARDLGLPVLPVQIGPVDSLRTAPVGEIQVVDYREQSGASGIALFAELDEAARKRQPLPDPLPLSPPVPFAYLLRLGAAIEAEQLTPAEQADLIGQLRDCLENEDDETVKEDARDLLRALRRRSDVTYRHAGEIEQMLVVASAASSAGQSTQAGSRRGPSPGRGADPGPGQTGAQGRPESDRPPAGPGTPTGVGAQPSHHGPPGGFGPPPPGPPRPGPPGYPPAGAWSYGPPGGSPPPGPGPKRRRLPLLLGVGFATAALLVVGGVLWANRGTSGPGPSPDPGPGVTTGQEPPPEPTAEDGLLSIPPADFDPGACSSQPPAGDGDLAALACGQAFTQPGPSGSLFHLYPAGSVDGVFLDDVTALGMAEHAEGQACPDFLGYSHYTNSGQLRGRVACWIGQDNASYLLWTEDDYDAEALVAIPNGGGQGIYVLWDWWVDSANSAFGG